MMGGHVMKTMEERKTMEEQMEDLRLKRDEKMKAEKVYMRLETRYLREHEERLREEREATQRYGEQLRKEKEITGDILAVLRLPSLQTAIGIGDLERPQKIYKRD